MFFHQVITHYVIQVGHNKGPETANLCIAFYNSIRYNININFFTALCNYIMFVSRFNDAKFLTPYGVQN